MWTTLACKSFVRFSASRSGAVVCPASVCGTDTAGPDGNSQVGSQSIIRAECAERRPDRYALNLLSPSTGTTNAGARAELWYLVNPASGTKTISLVTTGTLSRIIASGITYSGVNSATPFNTTVTTSTSGSGTSASLSTSANTTAQVLIDVLTKRGNSDFAYAIGFSNDPAQCRFSPSGRKRSLCCGFFFFRRIGNRNNAMDLVKYEKLRVRACRPQPCGRPWRSGPSQ